MRIILIVYFIFLAVYAFYRMIRTYKRKVDLKIMSFTIPKEEADSRELYKKAYQQETISWILWGIISVGFVMNQIFLDGKSFIVIMILGIGMIGTMIYIMVSKLRIEVKIEEENNRMKSIDKE